MDELLYTRADQPRLSPVGVLTWLIASSVFCVPFLMAGHWAAAGVVLGCVVVLGVVLRWVFRRAWMKVDQTGISYSQTGAGRTRRLAWHEIDGVQIAEAATQNGRLRVVKVVLRDGKRRTLPVLSDTEMRPDPDLDSKVAAIRALSERYGSVPPTLPFTVEAPWSRRNARFNAWTWRYLVPVVALPLLIMNGVHAGPAWTAHLGGGKRGTYTVTEVHCGRDCSWTGDFASDDGADTRYGVGFGSGGNLHRVGDRVPAVDTGDSTNVYPLGGGDDWMWLTAMTLGAGVLLILWIRSVPLRLLRARRTAAVASGD